MSFESEPKNIEDYKDVVKILKLKIIKQNRKIQQLQTKNKQYEDQLNNVTIGPISQAQVPQFHSPFSTDLKKPVSSANLQDFDTSSLKGKAAVMFLFLQGCKKFGITPQSIFRIADFAYKTEVESDYFRSVLSKINLGLTPKQISCLIFIFDENCSGFITRYDYHNSLHAYQVSMQDSSLPYNQECLLKLANLFHNDRIDLGKFYQQMESRAKNANKNNKTYVDPNVFEYQIRKVYGKKVLDRQIIGAFNEIDLQSQGYIDKTNFLYCVTSFVNRLLLGEDANTKKSGITLDWMQEGISGYISMQKDPKSTKPEANQSQSPGKFPGSNNNSQVQPNPPSNLSPSNLPPSNPPPKQNEAMQGALKLIQQNYKLTLPRIYEQLIGAQFPSRITLPKFKNIMSRLNDSIPPATVTKLFKEIDLHQKGSVYIPELIRFFLTNSNDCDTIYRLLGQYFPSNDLTSEKFMFMHGLEADSDISMNRFKQIMNKTFTSGLSTSGQQWNNIWRSFDKGNRGVANVGKIISTWQKYESA